MARRDLREPRLARRLRRETLMCRVGVSMHEDDGHGADAVTAGRLKRRAGGVEIELGLDRAVAAHALGHLDHTRVEQRGLLDTAGEDLGPGLITDLKRVAEALADDE